MLNHPTARLLRSLGLDAMAEAFVELQGMPDAADLGSRHGTGRIAR